jgi:hypothetical protein
MNVYSLTRFESTLALRGRKSKVPQRVIGFRRLSGLESIHLTGHPPAGATNALEQGFFDGRYWARTSDPQLVDSGQSSPWFAAVRSRRLVGTESICRLIATERERTRSVAIVATKLQPFRLVLVHRRGEPRRAVEAVWRDIIDVASPARRRTEIRCAFLALERIMGSEDARLAPRSAGQGLSDDFPKDTKEVFPEDASRFIIRVPAGDETTGDIREVPIVGKTLEVTGAINSMFWREAECLHPGVGHVAAHCDICSGQSVPTPTCCHPTNCAM